MSTFRIDVTLSVPCSFQLRTRDEIDVDDVWSRVKPVDLKAAISKFAATAHLDEIAKTTVGAWPRVIEVSEECPNVRDSRRPDPFQVPASVLMPAQVDPGFAARPRGADCAAVVISEAVAGSGSLGGAT